MESFITLWVLIVSIVFFGFGTTFIWTALTGDMDLRAKIFVLAMSTLLVVAGGCGSTWALLRLLV